MTTYTEAHKKYFEKHREEIIRRNREYKREYNKRYYRANKAKLAAQGIESDRTKSKQALRDSIYNQKPPE